MKRLSGLVLLSTLAALASSTAGDLSPETRARVGAWFEKLGPPKPGEEFGSYLARAAYLQHGVAYDRNDPLLLSAKEALEVELGRFECVTFIESSLAVARCGWMGAPDSSCFEREIVLSRYRGGEISDYSSRLHYFIDWIYDNEARGRLRNLTGELGGAPVKKDFFYITSRVLARMRPPGVEDLAELRRKVRATEESLSEREHIVLSRERAPAALAGLEDGDLVAFVRERPGLLVHHAGFVLEVKGRARLLHASSFHGRVVLTSDDVTGYLLRRPERKGMIVARPEPPPAKPR